METIRNLFALRLMRNDNKKRRKKGKSKEGMFARLMKTGLAMRLTGGKGTAAKAAKVGLGMKIARVVFGTALGAGAIGAGIFGARQLTQR